MATHYTAKIKLSEAIKIGIWVNSSKETLASVYKKLQAKYPGKEVYISNCGFFSMTDYIPCFGLKSEGKVYANSWSYGYMGFNGKTIEYCKPNASPSKFTDAVTGFPVLIENGKKSTLFSHCVDNSNRGRTMVGYTDDSIVLSVIEDASGTSDFTLDEELTFMLNQGCKYAINLDGGGSSQCNFNGKTITSTRRVANFIYIIREPGKANTNPVNSVNSITTNKADLVVGQEIKLKPNSVYYPTGKAIPNWVINSVLYVRKIYSDYITFSTLKTGAVTGNVSNKYIEGVKVNTSTTTTTPTTNTQPVKEAAVSGAYNIKVTATSLNIRSGPGTNYQIVGTITDQGNYGICQTSGNWGKLCNGKGWISLSYTKKLNW